MNQPKDTLLINEGAWKAAGQDTFIRKHFIEVVSHDLVALKPTIDPEGTGFLYWYVGINGDTVALDKELSTFEYEMPILMKQPFRNSDTIQPCSTVHGAPEAFVPKYFTHSEQVDTTRADVTHIACAVGLFLLAEFTLVKLINSGVIANFVKEVRDIWNAPNISRA